MPENVVALDDITYMAPEVNVVFVGIKGAGTMVQTVVAPLATLESTADTTVKEILVQAAADRFRLTREDIMDSHKFDIDGATFYRTTALTLAPQTKVDNHDTRVTMQAYVDAAPVPMKPLFLFAEMKIEKLAAARAKAAYTLYEALKVEASTAGIWMNDTKFSNVCGISKCATFSKAMGRVAGVASPVDGKLVVLLESRIAAYRADLTALKRDLAELEAVADMLNTELGHAPSPGPTANGTANAQTPDTEAAPETPVAAPLKPKFDKTANTFLQTFVSKYIADQKDRTGRVTTLKRPSWRRCRRNRQLMRLPGTGRSMALIRGW